MSHTNISPLPWTYHKHGNKDWIEDANGDIQLEAVCHLDGPFICEAVNNHDRLTRENRILQLKADASLANNLCPDHRDKQEGRPCLACEIERLQSKNDRITAEVGRLKLATLRAVDYFKARNLGDTAEELLKYLQEALNPEEPK